ncbi:MAG: adenylate kinase [Eubacteriales bacterium]|nr:adenylate kinase [Eubacteriales bacterium]
MNNIVLLGPPGAGKGSIAVLLSKALELPHISTGAIFRDEISAQTPLGIEADSYIKNGALVPDHLTNRIIAGRLTKPDCDRGFILDGYPRSAVQAQVLSDMLELWQRELRAAILIEASEEIIIKRLSRRHVCSLCALNYNYDPEEVEAKAIKCKVCGGSLKRREDDKIDAIRNRLKIYDELSKPLIDFYEQRHKLYRVVNAERSLAETSRIILEHLGEKVPEELML